MEGAAALFGHTTCEMKCICLLQIFLQITLHGTTQAQDLELLVINPSNGVFKEGEKLKLQCRYSAGLACIYWFKDAIRISVCSNYIYEVLMDSNSGGSYQCGVVFSRWQKSKPVDVVTIASDMKLSLVVTPKATMLGENITMNCLVPAVKWTGPKLFLWYRNEELVARNNQPQYTIRRAKRSDGASYRCELQIKYRKWISPEVDVTVTGIAVSKPGLTIHPGKELMNGNTASLLCSVSNGSTPITYIFYKDSDIELYREDSDLTEITYKLSNVNKSTEGSYSCSVTNEVTELPVQSELVAVAVAATVIELHNHHHSNGSSTFSDRIPDCIDFVQTSEQEERQILKLFTAAGGVNWK
ncbi:Fc receptor-like protein 5 isoform X2 [Heterodontus francisci]|uniref:Fc receptor-like protein 5 isoform X2 n=1 Tax=Heterodontus francisci TaxID=7792 RepID=UPI00355AFAC1